MEATTVSHFLFLLARTSGEAAILAVLVLAAGWLFRWQLTPRWRSALWLLVAARLLLPFSFGSITSVFNFLPKTIRLEPAGLTPMPPVSMAAADKQIPSGPLVNRGNKPDAAQESAKLIRTPFTAGPSIIENRFKWSWPVCIFGIWLAGVLVLARHIVISSYQLRRGCTLLPAVCRSRVMPLLNECCGRLQMRNPPAVFENAVAGGPALYGLLRPRLILPKGFTEQFSPAEQRFVFLHELAHLKRRDLLMNWLAVILQVVHWFNPLIWFAFSRWRVERELACDVMALEAADKGQNMEYGRTILRLLDRFSRPMAMPGLVGILENKRQLRRRIGMIATFVPGQDWPSLAIALMGLLAVVGLTDARSKTSWLVNTPSAASSAVSPATTANSISDAGIPAASRIITSPEKGLDMFNTTMTNRLAGVVAASVLALASPLTAADAQAPAKPAVAVPDSANDLIGAWVLVGKPDHIGKAPSAGGRIKLFTGTHWCITQAEPKSGVVLFHHGGTYSVSQDTFHANLSFANSSTMNMIGKTNGDFTFKIEGDRLTNIGVDNPWQEVWQRLKPRGTIDSPLAKDLTGTWVYVGNLGGPSGAPNPNRMKFCAGGYWCDTETDAKTGVVVIHHGGYYSLKGQKYVETCQYANPTTMDLIGQDVKFDIKIEGDTLTLKGLNNPFNEVWKRLD